VEHPVELSRKLLVTLKLTKHRGSTLSLIGDESWFSLTIDYEQQWLSPGAERPTRPRKMISSPQATIIFWSHDPGSPADGDIHIGILRRCHFATDRRIQASW
jgi:hypothetical protein